MKQEVTVDGLKININIEESGSGDTTLLMVHGIPTNARLWRHVQAALPQYRTLAMDMVGYGQSDMPLDKFKHSFMNQAEAVKGVIEGLGLKGKVILVAHDHGGGVAQVFATKYCDYISRLVLINPVCFDQWPVCEVEALAGLDGADDATLQMAMGQAVAGFPALMRMGSYDGAPFTDKNCKQNYLQFWGRGPGMTGFKSLIRISADPQNSDTDVDHSKITCPTMVMWGVADNFMSCEAAKKLKERISGPTRVQYIERAGHWVQEDRPDEVAKYINDFVTEWAGVNL
jgi:pimeloyl-ACP methyl ester carboxylesterase